jgi:transcriptional regulator with XRE-family HTH domain
MLTARVGCGSFSEQAVPDQQLSAGRRIAQFRKLSRMTQLQLSARAGYALSTVRAVEQERIPASPAFVAAAARALGRDVCEINGQPYGDPLAAPAHDDHRAVPDLRRALIEYDHVQFDGQPPTLEDIDAELSAIKHLYGRSNYREVTARLPDVLRRLQCTIDAEPAVQRRERGYSLLTLAYGKALATLYKLGYLDLAGIATERARWAATRSGDPLWTVVAEFYRSLLLLFSGAYATGLRVIDRAYMTTEGLPSSSALHAVRGALHLRAALLNARASDRDAAESRLNEARSLARMIDESSPNHYDAAFRPSNVDIHSVAVPLELHDGTAAVTRAQKINLPPSVKPTRAGHHWIDLARAWHLHGDRQRTLTALNKARRIAPQLTRYHPQVHETVRVLAAQERRQSESLGNFVGWLGVKL